MQCRIVFFNEKMGLLSFTLTYGSYLSIAFLLLCLCVGRGRGGEAAGGGGEGAQNHTPHTNEAPSPKPKPNKPTAPVSSSSSTSVPVPVTCNGDITPKPSQSQTHTNTNGGLSALSQQIAYAREQIASSLRNKTTSSSGGVGPSEDDEMIREENLRLKQQLEQLQAQVNKLTERVGRLEGKLTNGASGDSSNVAKKPAPADGEDDVDLFGSDEEEDAEAAKIKEQRLAEYAAKKSKKPTLIAKSNVILDVKPWDGKIAYGYLE